MSMEKVGIFLSKVKRRFFSNFSIEVHSSLFQRPPSSSKGGVETKL